MQRRNRSARVLPVVATAVAAAGLADAQGCFVVESERRSISVSTGRESAEVSIGTWAKDAVSEGQPTCFASTSVKLSSFPTSTLATRPREVAESIRDAVAELKATECRVVVWYVNDTGEERREDERCLAETFRFDGDAYWSTSSETSCWETA